LENKEEEIMSHKGDWIRFFIFTGTCWQGAYRLSYGYSLFSKIVVPVLVIAPVALFMYIFYRIIFKGIDDEKYYGDDKYIDINECIDFTPHPDHIKYRESLDKKTIDKK